MRRGVTLALALALAMVLAMTAAAGAATGPVPTVTGPVTGGKGSPSLLTTFFDLADFGYESSRILRRRRRHRVHEHAAAEYGRQVDGDARVDGAVRHANRRATGPSIPTTSTAPCSWSGSTSRRVSTSRRAGCWRTFRCCDRARRWSAVSAQAVGVQGGATIIGQQAAGGIKKDDPERYASI